MTDDDLRFSAQEYATLLSWYMASDPWPITSLESDRIKRMLNDEARYRGYDDWITAYHHFHGEEVEQ